jgi:hypothetical protein
MMHRHKDGTIGATTTTGRGGNPGATINIHTGSRASIHIFRGRRGPGAEGTVDVQGASRRDLLSITEDRRLSVCPGHEGQSRRAKR